MEAIDLFVLHQANARIIDGAREALGISADRFLVNLDRYGNTSAASIPLALADAEAAGKFQRGDVVLMEAIGGGLTWGSALARW